ncbi:hypothetical protein Tco_0037284, partial [Tanacetum coccineum]
CGGGGVGCGGTAAGEEGRVRESDLGDWVDPVTRIIFGVHRKTPPEKFSGGGWPEMVAEMEEGRWPDKKGEREL